MAGARKTGKGKAAGDQLPGTGQSKATGKFIAVLVRQLKQSLLPGDKAVSAQHLEEAADFLLSTAQSRKPASAALALETASNSERVTRIAIVNDDMPFLVDSVAATVAAHGLAIDCLLHPVLAVRRDGDGLLCEILGPDNPGERRESLIYLETERIDARQRRALTAALAATLGDVRAAVEDWPKLQAAMALDADGLADPEGAALLRWLNAGMLTQLGHVIRRRDGREVRRLGVCRKSTRSPLSDATCERAFAWFEKRGKGDHGHAPLIVKANHIAHVHRRAPLDLFIVPIHENGVISALSIHAGTWTSAALSAPPQDVPRLRTQLSAMMNKFGFSARSHDGKALIHATTVLPHDLVVGFSEHDLERVAMEMMSLVDRPRPRLAVVQAPLERHIFAFVWMPRDMVSTLIRQRVALLLADATGATLLDWSLQIDGGGLALLRFVFDSRMIESHPDEDALEAGLIAMLRGWGGAVEAELAKTEEPARAAALAARYADSFPPAYRADYDAGDAATDILRLRRFAASEYGADHQRDARLYRHQNDAENQLRLKIYQHGGGLPLSDAVPALENFGFRVLAEVPTFLTDSTVGSLHDFILALPDAVDASLLLEQAESIEAAIAAVLNDAAQDDPFNRLLIHAGLSATETDWLRAMFRYLRQAGARFAISTVVNALGRATTVANGLIALFRACHDPAFSGKRDAGAEAARETIRAGLVGVAAINDDRLLRQFHHLVEAIWRTNAFTPAAAEALVFKIDSAGIPGLAKPVPWCEIFVCSRRVEGIHLRAGPVARGGIRWSDRRDDFRTEVLGLMKAQRVKNAVIVPTGAKGGFYPKQLPDPLQDREGWAGEGQAAYEIFIRSLLSVTDNIVKDKITHPADVVVRDGDDPYFVVAADKGTARFSDIANGIAQSQGFWLDDAFASGGSNGYDHKAMGITARGAWLSVQRHFLEMGVDVQKDPVRVIGCGDMSGDVFGNGMLLSRAIKLVAAFDHRHIFIDPDPDPARSWKERKRLFGLARSSWDDYDKALISRGGGVFPRSAKSIKLSAAMRKLLDIDVAETDPDTLIAAILRSAADLLWFGGIGTYVKAAGQSNADVGDPGNDELRVNAGDVRTKVIGEGANLGITQAGRIEFSLAGGRINTDFIDNSAGVDCSDNEVNIKIALTPALQSGKLSVARRNALLVDMTRDVADLVLEDNRLQALVLSIAEAGGVDAMPAYLRLIEMLEETGSLDRRTEGFADHEALTRRAADGFGLTRPELAVLLSSAKLVIQNVIEGSDLPDQPGLEPILLAAFPEQMRGPFGKAIENHALRREIIATRLANMVVNRLGVVHPFELAEEEGASLADVASAFITAARLFEIPAIWQVLESSEMPEEARLMLFGHLAIAMRNQMADLLRSGLGDGHGAELEQQLSPGIRSLSKGLDSLLSDDAHRRSARLIAQLCEAGAREADAALVARLFSLDGAVGLVGLACKSGVAPDQLTAIFADLGEQLGLDWAQACAAVMNPSDPWERLLVSGLARDFQQIRFDFLGHLIARKSTTSNPEAALERWLKNHEPTIRQFRAMVMRAQRATPVTPAMLAQIAGQARNLLGR